MNINSQEFKNIENELDTNFQKFCTLSILANHEKPQLRYNNIKRCPYLKGINDNTEFCIFKPNLPFSSGVYLWVVENEIIYIGQAENLNSRFGSTGYGRIQPRNCYKGGQSTNVKMNLVAKRTYDEGKTIDIYIFKTNNYIDIEAELLFRIKTKYNKKH